MRKDNSAVYMAVDQYGETVHGLRFPRKELCERYSTSHADKMYVDQKDGSTLHVGYVVRGHWFTLYRVERFEVKA